MINWEEAPEGTTHCVYRFEIAGSPWRKISVEERKVYNWSGVGWVEREIISFDDYLEINANCLAARPAPPVEAELPEGKVWLEGADFYYPHLGVFFRYDAPAFKYQHDANWTPLMPVHIEQYAKKDVIHRFPGAKPKAAPKEEPPKKRAVGWWN